MANPSSVIHPSSAANQGPPHFAALKSGSWGGGGCVTAQQMFLRRAALTQGRHGERGEKRANIFALKRGSAPSEGLP